MKTLSCVVKKAKKIEIISQTINSLKPGETLVKITRGGICGSDLHYYQHGKIGNYPVLHPMILGHEVIGKIIQTDSPHLVKNQKIAINPSKSCGHCKYCKENNTNQCESMRFLGSAMYTPHVDGGFSQFKIIDNTQCIPYQENISDEIMVFAEPLAVAIHACKQAGNLIGKRIFISGVGPIGCLIVAAAKVSGAKQIICTDLSQRCLTLAKQMGATETLHTSDDFSEYTQHKGTFDLAFEVAGQVNSLERCITVTKAKGTIIQVGMLNNPINFPIMNIIAKEINLLGSFRFSEEFNTAVEWLSQNKINPLPLLSAIFHFTDLNKAFETACDKQKVAKVQLTFD